LSAEQKDHASEDHTGPVASESLGLDRDGREELSAMVDGYRMRYLRTGCGHPLVLQHGLLGYLFSWRFCLPVLASKATVYAVDALGAGYSEKPPVLDYSLRATARRLLHFLDQVGVDTFDLLGTSHGGAVAMMVAAIDAEQSLHRLQKLLLIAPVNPWSRHGEKLAPFLGSRLGSVLFLRTIARMRSKYRYWLERLYGDPRRIASGTLEGYSAPYQSAEDFEHGLRIAAGWTADLLELKSVLPSIADYPTLLLWGSRDRAVDPQSAEELGKVFRHAQLVVLPEIGHLPYEECPEEFNRVVINFLISWPPRRNATL
jgi:pimeloyl-ACP methyl ester carboxylesterase